jgi:hypothetical protein
MDGLIRVVSGQFAIRSKVSLISSVSLERIFMDAQGSNSIDFSLNLKFLTQ